jgi:protein-tyrosine phosphatase
VQDGLFLGDKDSSQDYEFLSSSKITKILNCASAEVRNEWESTGITYLSFPFKDTEDELIFDELFETFFKCFDFIESALESGESILVHSVKCECRSVTIVLSFLMHKYKWSLTKSLEFLNSRKPDCKLKPNFLMQLVKLEAFLMKISGLLFSKTWDLTGNEEENLLRNTFLNSKPGEFVRYDGKVRKKKKVIKWLDGFVDCKRIQSASNRRIVRNLSFACRGESENRKEVKRGLKSCLKGVKVLENLSNGDNCQVVRNSSERNEVAGSGEIKSKRLVRNSSGNKRENSLIMKDFQKGKEKTKKKSNSVFALFDVRKNVRREIR